MSYNAISVGSERVGFYCLQQLVLSTKTPVERGEICLPNWCHQGMERANNDSKVHPESKLLTFFFPRVFEVREARLSATVIYLSLMICIETLKPNESEEY